MKEACEGAYRERAWRCAVEMFFSPVFVTCGLPLTRATVHIVLIYLISIFFLPFIVSYFPPQSLSLRLCLTLSLSFCHNSKYPVGPGCSLLVLVYLALGSIRLQAEASHSSQSHKMWLVLTTALQGDGLIGLIASDRLGWTLYRMTTATACCGFILAVSDFSSFFKFFFTILCLPFSHPSFSIFSLLFSVFVFNCLQTVFFLNIISFFCLFHIQACQDCTCTNYIAAVKLRCQYCQFYPPLILQSHIKMVKLASTPLKPHSLYPHTAYLCGMWPPLSANHGPQSLLVAESSSEAVIRSEAGNTKRLPQF